MPWDGDEVAGMVRSYIPAAENERRGRKRGWVEDISVRRPWRRRSTNLIAASFPLLHARGMTEAALNVDTENEHGALGLHERCGFRPVSRRPMFSMTLEQGAGARTSSASFRPTSTPAAGGAVVLAAGLPRHPDAAAGRAG